MKWMDTQDSLAEWSKALAQGASPQGRGFEPHSCHFMNASSWLVVDINEKPLLEIFSLGHLIALPQAVLHFCSRKIT